MDIRSTAIGAGFGLVCSLITWYVTDFRQRRKRALRLLLFYLEHVNARLQEITLEFEQKLEDLDQSQCYPSFDIPQFRTALVDRALEQWSPRTDQEREVFGVILKACETVEALEGRLRKGNITAETLRELQKNARVALERVKEACEKLYPIR